MNNPQSTQLHPSVNRTNGRIQTKKLSDYKEKIKTTNELIPPSQHSIKISPKLFTVPQFPILQSIEITNADSSFSFGDLNLIILQLYWNTMFKSYVDDFSFNYKCPLMNAFKRLFIEMDKRNITKCHSKEIDSNEFWGQLLVINKHFVEQSLVDMSYFFNKIFNMIENELSEINFENNVNNIIGLKEIQSCKCENQNNHSYLKYFDINETSTLDIKCLLTNSINTSQDYLKCDKCENNYDSKQTSFGELNNTLIFHLKNSSKQPLIVENEIELVDSTVQNSIISFKLNGCIVTDDDHSIAFFVKDTKWYYYDKERSSIHLIKKKEVLIQNNCTFYLFYTKSTSKNVPVKQRHMIGKKLALKETNDLCDKKKEVKQLEMDESLHNSAEVKGDKPKQEVLKQKESKHLKQTQQEKEEIKKGVEKEIEKIKVNSDEVKGIKVKKVKRQRLQVDKCELKQHGINDKEPNKEEKVIESKQDVRKITLNRIKKEQLKESCSELPQQDLIKEGLTEIKEELTENEEVILDKKENDVIESIPKTHYLQEQLTWIIEYTQINVQQGDSSLVLIKYGDTIVKSILIDCGEPDYSTNIVKRTIENNNINILDAFVITHWHKDHCGGSAAYGLIQLLETFSNKEQTHIFASENEKPNLFFLNKYIKKEHQHIGFDNIFMKHNDDELLPLSLLDNFMNRNEIPNHIDIQVVCVNEHCVGVKSSVSVRDKYIENNSSQPPNLTSLGILLTNNSSTLLTCGDLGTSCSSCLKDYFKKVNVIKVNHHGSKNNNIIHKTLCLPDFDVALLSFGKRSVHKHPDIETIHCLFDRIKQLYPNEIQKELTQKKRVVCTNWPFWLLTESKIKLKEEKMYEKARDLNYKNSRTLASLMDAKNRINAGFEDIFQNDVNNYLKCAQEDTNIEVLLNDNGSFQVICKHPIDSVYYNNTTQEIETELGGKESTYDGTKKPKRVTEEDDKKCEPKAEDKFTENETRTEFSLESNGKEE
ncbi:hypothetical protein QTN25_007055 [Entamoeba marina]